MANSELVLIIIVINAGFAEPVMDIARAQGVRGGTITHCRGTANEAMAKKYGVYVTPDKEMIWIVADKTIADPVISAIHEKVSDKNPGQCFIFSVPVDNAVGFKLNPSADESEENQKK